jgi:hypothetical protein
MHQLLKTNTTLYRPHLQEMLKMGMNWLGFFVFYKNGDPGP